jgi:hypothetical protein
LSWLISSQKKIPQFHKTLTILYFFPIFAAYFSIFRPNKQQFIRFS